MFISKLKNIKFNGVLRTPRILDSYCRNTYWALFSLEKDLLGQRTFFRADYAKEVENIIKIINNANGFGDFAELLGKNPTRTKEVIQHIYTVNQSLYEKFKESFHIQNTSPTNHGERNKIYEEYWAKMHIEIEKISTLKPEFGCCTACWNYLDRNQKKKFKNLKDVDESFWNPSTW